MKSALLLDVVVRQSPAILQLFTGEDQPLLVWGNSLLVLDLGLHIFDGVGRLHLKGDGLTSEGLDEDLHSSSQTKHKMKSALLLDVVIRQSPAILQLFTGEDQPLLVWGNSLLVLDLSLHILDGVGRLHLKGDGLASESLHEDLHSSSQTKHEMESALLLDVVVRQSPAVLQLLASEDEPLLVRGDSFLVLNLSLHVFDGIRWLNLEGDGLSSEGFHENLHFLCSSSLCCFSTSLYSVLFLYVCVTPH